MKIWKWLPPPSAFVIVSLLLILHYGGVDAYWAYVLNMALIGCVFLLVRTSVLIGGCIALTAIALFPNISGQVVSVLLVIGIFAITLPPRLQAYIKTRFNVPKRAKFYREIYKSLNENPGFAAAAKERYNGARKTLIFFSVISILLYVRLIGPSKITFLTGSSDWEYAMALALLVMWSLYNFVVSVEANELGQTPSDKQWYFFEVRLPTRLGFLALFFLSQQILAELN